MSIIQWVKNLPPMWLCVATEFSLFRTGLSLTSKVFQHYRRRWLLPSSTPLLNEELSNTKYLKRRVNDGSINITCDRTLPRNNCISLGYSLTWNSTLGGALVTKSCLTLVTPWTVACQAPLSMGFCLWDSPSKNTGEGCYFLLQVIFPTQESNLGLLHCRQILYWLSYEANPKIAPLAWPN